MLLLCKSCIYQMTLENSLQNFCCAGLWPRKVLQSVVSQKFTKPIFMEVYMVSDLKPVKKGRQQATKKHCK